MSCAAVSDKTFRKQVSDDLDHAQPFYPSFKNKIKLGEGSDGSVWSYLHQKSERRVAIKFPTNTSKECRDGVISEIQNLKTIRDHKNIVMMFGSTFNHKDVGLSIVLEQADLGDVGAYRERYMKQQMLTGKQMQIPETTIWKLFKDMCCALDHIHNKLKIKYVHGDFKPDNILVFTPPHWDSKKGLPTEPIFKLSDFARLTTECARLEYRGTPEYAPPLVEQQAAKQSGDIWSLGLTMQFLALGHMPTESREAFVERRKKEGKNHPEDNDYIAFRMYDWRIRRLTVYRPLNVSLDVLEAEYDMSRHIQNAKHWVPYSNTLNKWYATLFDMNEGLRITAKDLLKYAVPCVDAEINQQKAQAAASEKFVLAQATRERERPSGSWSFLSD